MGFDRTTRTWLGAAPRWVGLVALAGLAVVVANLAQIDLLARTVVRATGTGAPVGGLLLALVLVAACRAAFVAAGRAAEHRAAHATRDAVLGRIVAKLERLGPVVVAEDRRGEAVSLATDGVDALDAYVSVYLPRFVLGLATPPLVLLYLATVDWVAAVVLAVLVPAMPALIAVINRRFRAVSAHYLATSTRLGAEYLEAVQGLTTLKALGAAGRRGRALADRGETLRRDTMRLLAVNQVALLVVDLAFSLGTVIAATLLAVTRAGSGAIGPVAAVVIVLVSVELTRPLQLLGSFFFAGGLGRAALADLRRFLDQPDAVGDAAEPDAAEPDTGSSDVGEPGSGAPDAWVRAVPERAGRTAPPGVATSGPPRLSVEAVTYHYPDGTVALDRVDLTLEPGETLAVAGPSGSGKTTLLALLNRYVDPTSGAVRLDGVPLTALPTALVHRLVTLVPQDPYLFHGTVRDNLLRARPDATARQLDAAIEAADVGAVVAALPHGLDTPIGDRGVRLSGGQAQRLAIARALLSPAPIVLLDEPTAQLDAGSEAAVTAGLRALAGHRSLLVIAHRASTLREADRVVLLVDGRVVETGPPRDLERAGGPYAALLAGTRGEVPA